VREKPICPRTGRSDPPAGTRPARRSGVAATVILLPSKNNLPFVHWASRALWWQLLQSGCHIWLTLPPFNHSKLTVVDSHWVLLGSANWDARSLRLNFELNVECYGQELARNLGVLVERKLHGAREVTLAVPGCADDPWEAARRGPRGCSRRSCDGR